MREDRRGVGARVRSVLLLLRRTRTRRFLGFGATGFTLDVDVFERPSDRGPSDRGAGVAAGTGSGAASADRAPL